MLNIGPRLAKNLLAYWGDAERVFNAKEAKLFTAPGMAIKDSAAEF